MFPDRDVPLQLLKHPRGSDGDGSGDSDGDGNGGAAEKMSSRKFTRVDFAWIFGTKERKIGEQKI